MSGKSKKAIGSNDSSITSINDDLFQIRQYVDGLAMFINHCVTPMTISIQGDWGSGKTSIMNMVMEKLGDNTIPIWFNTWQYSQFNLGEDLTLSLLGRLIKVLKPEQAMDGKAADFFEKTFRIIKTVGWTALNQAAGKTGQELLNSLAKDFSEGKDDAADTVDSLKNVFQECVDYAIKRDRKDRVVVFIDDLDRLNPVKAVELLEVLKVFLDCENCVFVLAIDYAVVSSGVKEKYGDLIGTDKGRQFFDKIIQVPFKMPVAHYQVRKFVVEMLHQTDPSFTDDDTTADIYVRLIQHSVGFNPRTMKRLFNAYLLLLCVGKNVNITEKIEDSTEGPWYRKMLFAILCCQHAYEDLYTFIVRNKSEVLGADILEELKNPATYRGESGTGSQAEEGEKDEQDEVLSELQSKFKTVSDDLISRMSEFMEYFISVIDKSGDKVLDEEEELAALEEILSISAITTTGPEDEGSRMTSRGSEIVPEVELLDMGELSNEKKKEIAEFLQSIDSNVVIQFVQGKSGHIVAKTWSEKGKTFADIYGLKKGFNAYVYVPEANLFTHRGRMPELVKWVDDHGYNLRKNPSKRIKVKVLNAKDEADLRKLLGLVYSAWDKYGKK